jgi:hypothetical protein
MRQVHRSEKSEGGSEKVEEEGMRPDVSRAKHRLLVVAVDVKCGPFEGCVWHSASATTVG